MRVIKYFFYGLIVLLILFVLAIVIATQTINPNNYKAEIEALARKNANIELSINGDIRWNFYPWLGLSLNDTSVASLNNPKQPIASIKHVEASIRVLPLIQKKIEMSDFTLNGFSLFLSRDSAGKGNWEDLILNPATNSATDNSTVNTPIDDTTISTAPTSTPPTDHKNKNMIDLSIRSLSITNATLHFDDQQNNKRYELNNINLKTGKIVVNQPIQLQLSGDFAQDSKALNLTFDLKTRLEYQLKNQHYQLQEFGLTGSLTGDLLKGNTVNIKLNSDISAELNQRTFRLAPFTLDGSLTEQQTSIPFSLHGALLLDLNADSLIWESPEISFNHATVKSAQLTLNQLSKNPIIKAEISSNSINPRILLPSLGISLPATNDAHALTALSFSTDLNASASNISLKNLSLTLDQTSITGDLTLSELDKQGKVSATLRGNQLDIDRYLTPAPDSENSGKIPTNTPSSAPKPTNDIWSRTPIFSVNDLRRLNLNLDLTMDQITFNKEPWKKLALKLSANQGIISIDRLKAQLYAGTLSLTGKINATTNTPQITLSPTISSLSIAQFLEKQKMDLPLRGILNLHGNFNTRGDNLNSIISHLNGNAQVEITNGTLIGVNYDREFCTGIALLNKDVLTTPFTDTNTDFHTLSASVTLKQGVAHNSDLSIATTGVALHGNGTFNLKTMNLDYGINASITGDPRDYACRVNKEFRHFAIPIRCQGSVLSHTPSCKLDDHAVGEMLTNYLSTKIEQKLEKKANHLEQRIEKKKQKLDDKINSKIQKETQKLMKKLDGLPKLDKLFK